MTENGTNESAHDMTFFQPLERQSTRFSTNKLLPHSTKSKTKLLSIISNLYNNEVINVDERGILKDKVLYDDVRVINYLDEYDVKRDSYAFYNSLINLIKL